MLKTRKRRRNGVTNILVRLELPVFPSMRGYEARESGSITNTHMRLSRYVSRERERSLTGGVTSPPQRHANQNSAQPPRVMMPQSCRSSFLPHEVTRNILPRSEAAAMASLGGCLLACISTPEREGAGR